MSDINNKLDKLDGRIDNIDITLAKQSVILEDHVRRSLSNEKAVDVLRVEVQERHQELMNHLNPLLKYADRFVFLMQLGGSIVALLGAVVTILELMKALK